LISRIAVIGNCTKSTREFYFIFANLRLLLNARADCKKKKEYNKMVGNAAGKDNLLSWIHGGG
jgi:hypothetical protein